MKKFFLGLIVWWAIVFAYFFVKENPDNTILIKLNWLISNTKETNKIGIANPASTYCIENNWTLEIINESEWSYWICTFPDGSSCEERAFFRWECWPNQTKENSWTNNEELTVCTMEYAPVCAKVNVQCIKAPCEPIEQTFGNRCMMEANKLATFLYEGECWSKEIECPQYVHPWPDYCKDWILRDWWVDENWCKRPPLCEK